MKMKTATEPTQVNRRKATVSRMTREFSESVREKDAQPCLNTQSCLHFVPGMSQYGESQEFSEVESSVGHKGSMSLSTFAAQIAELSPSLDRVQESTSYTRDFSPTSR